MLALLRTRYSTRLGKADPSLALSQRIVAVVDVDDSDSLKVLAKQEAEQFVSEHPDCISPVETLFGFYVLRADDVNPIATFLYQRISGCSLD